jgi:benzodiazapine receptor
VLAGRSGKHGLRLTAAPPIVHSEAVRSNLEDSPPASPPPRGRGWTRQAAALAGFLLASWAVSLLGSLPIRLHGGGWYAAAEKAPWTPPGWMFTAVWLTLYAAMAVAAWLVWRQRRSPRRSALRIYALQLALNLAWPPVFFGLYPVLGVTALWLALLVLAALAVTAMLTVLRFGPISTVAGVLMLPNVSWIVFSGSLNLYAALNN